MTKDQTDSSDEWQQFEQLVARIEADAAPLGLTIKSPDRIRCKLTGRMREVDASIRAQVGTTSILVTIECRKRGKRQDVTWIEQLAAKKFAIGADRTIAVSASGFSADAEATARLHNIDLRRLRDVSINEINNLMRLDFVLFTHKKCSLIRVGIRGFNSADWIVPDPSQVDFTLPPDTDPFLAIFRNEDTGSIWSLNDLWLQLQEVTDPFAGILRGAPPTIRTACFPYPGDVSVDTPNGPKKIGDVLISFAIALETEYVDIGLAKKIEYTAKSGVAIQRVEFSSSYPQTKDWRISLQMPRDSTDLSNLKTGGNWPNRT